MSRVHTRVQNIHRWCLRAPLACMHATLQNPRDQGSRGCGTSRTDQYGSVCGLVSSPADFVLARSAAHTAKKLPNRTPSHKTAVSRPWQQRCLIWSLAAKRLSLSSYLDSSEVIGRGGVASRSPLDLLSRNRSRCIAHVHSHAHSRTRVSLSGAWWIWWIMSLRVR
jgi:hypothetical protein